MQNRGMVPNHEASAIKLYAAELSQRVASTGVKVAGLYGQLDRDSKLGADAATNRYAPNKGRLVRTYLNAVSGDDRRRHGRGEPQHHRGPRAGVAAGLTLPEKSSEDTGPMPDRLTPRVTGV